MEMWAKVRSWFGAVTERERMEREMAEELRAHVEMRADDLQRAAMAEYEKTSRTPETRQGAYLQRDSRAGETPPGASRREVLSREEALRLARLEFGSAETHKEECRESLGLRLWDELLADVRYASRVMRKAPGFTAVAVLTLAIGIGANTAIFTLLDAILFRMVPVHRAGELFLIERGRKDVAESHFSVLSNPIFEGIKKRQDVFGAMAAWGDRTFNLAQGGTRKPANGMFVSGEYFSALDMRPEAGRLIGPGDDVRGCSGVAVLSHSFWQEHYGGAASAIGSTLMLDSKPFTVVGVTPQGFYGLNLGSKFDVAVPLCSIAVFSGSRPLESAGHWWLSAFGRMKTGITSEQATARLNVIGPQVWQETLIKTWPPESQKNYLSAVLRVAPIGAGLSWTVTQHFAQPLKILMAVVGMVLLIACANVAALMLAKAAAQSREIAVRLALGASRMRVARQLLTHAVMLSVAGAAIGTLIAFWGTNLLVRALSTQSEKTFLDLTPDWRVVMFTAGVAVATGMLFGILPAMRSSKAPLTDAMRGSAASQTERDSPLRKWIVASQIALSLVLLVTAGLFLRSFVKLVRLDPGFEKRGVMLVDVQLKNTSIKPENRQATFQRIAEKLRALPGVESATPAFIVPLGHSGWNEAIIVPNGPKGESSISMMDAVAPGYLDTMRMTLLEGRDFNANDTKSSPLVAIVNQTFAKRFYGSGNAVGQVFRLEEDEGKPGKPIEVIAVVRDAKYNSLRDDAPPTAFVPLTQMKVGDDPTGLNFAVRTAGNPESLRKPIEAAVAEVSREIPLVFSTLEDNVNDAMVQERLLAMLSGFFGAVALLLAMVGLYGTISYRVTMRKAEFGIRMALGAQVANIVNLVLREVAVIVAVGVAAGTVLSLAAANTVKSLLYAMVPRDAVTLAGCAGVLGLAALAAGYVPARRASKVDPMVALRYE